MHEFCFNLVWLICVFLCSSAANFFLLFSVPPCLRGECIFMSVYLRQLFLLFSASPRLRGERYFAARCLLSFSIIKCSTIGTGSGPSFRASSLKRLRSNLAPSAF